MSSSSADDVNGSCEFRQNLALLRSIDFFASLPIEVLKVLAYLCTREQYAAGESMLTPGDDDGQAFLILSGEAEAVVPEGAAPGSSIRRYGPGAFLGGLALLASMPRLFELRALSELACLVITRAQFDRVLEQYPDVIARILRNVVARVRQWESMLLREREIAGAICRQTLGVSLL